MAMRIPLEDAVELDLPGRRSREILSGAGGAQSTLRMVEIAAPALGAAPRPPHWHPDCEECIHVLSGDGVTWVEGQEFPMGAGDTVRIAAGERHVTRNTGLEPLVLFCFFPVPQVTILTEGASGYER